MLVKKCLFDPGRDLRAVEPLGFVDLQEALVNHNIPSQIADTEDSYNGIEDPSSILGKPSDIFDALRMQQGYMEHGSSSSEDGDPSAITPE